MLLDSCVKLEYIHRDDNEHVLHTLLPNSIRCRPQPNEAISSRTSSSNAAEQADTHAGDDVDNTQLDVGSRIDQESEENFNGNATTLLLCRRRTGQTAQSVGHGSLPCKLGIELGSFVLLDPSQPLSQACKSWREEG